MATRIQLRTAGTLNTHKQSTSFAGAVDRQDSHDRPETSFGSCDNQLDMIPFLADAPDYAFQFHPMASRWPLDRSVRSLVREPEDLLYPESEFSTPYLRSKAPGSV